MKISARDKYLSEHKTALPRFMINAETIEKSALWLRREAASFAGFAQIYVKDKIFTFSDFFEGYKNSVVKGVLIKRGKRNRMFLHTTAMALLTVGVVISPFISESSLLSKDSQGLYAQELATGPATLETTDVFQTQESQKPRDEIIEYTVQKGDTISTIAKKFGVSEDTIKWENDLRNDSITVGDTLKILPVTGISHKVARGDTVYTIAKKYDTHPQGLVDFPFNDFANPQTFSLIEGDIIIVPDGVEPAQQPTYVRPRSYIATGPTSVSDAGFAWPVRGTINQSYSWYHKAVDIGADVGTPIVAAQSGTIVGAYAGGWHGGYGIHVIVSGDNGYQTLYAHMSSLGVGVGDKVTAGRSVIGWVGMTGRTTGPHLHFEIRGNGLFNPLSFLR